ncbi:unnamed protein product [Closterium sp. Naga37s-1]|nr:unnamed protein product [Closterium sp. Naga37s-1]
MLSAVKFVRVDSAGERKKDSSGHKVKPRKGSDDSSDSEHEKRRKKRKRERGGKKGKRKGRRGSESEAGESESDIEDGRATRRARKREERRKRRGKWIEDVADGSDDSEGSDEEGDEIRAGVTAVHCTLLSLNASTPFLSAPPVLLSPSPGVRPGAGSGAGFDGGLGARSEGAGQGGQQAREAAGLEWMMRAPERPLSETRAVEEEEEKGRKECFSAPFRVALIPLWYAALVVCVFQHVVLGSSARELNPYFKTGDGFPDSAAAHPAADPAAHPAAQRPGSARPAPPPGVGDGGASWRLKALRRAKEQAEREGKRLSEVVSDRRGGRDDGGEEEEDEEEERRMRGGRRGYLEGVSAGARAGMRVPQQESVSWRRRGEGGAPGGRGGAGGKVRDGEGGEGKGSEERKQAWKGVGAWRPGMGVGRRGGWADGVLEEAARSVNAFADDGGFLAQQLARGDVAGHGVGGGESEKGVAAGEEARGADGGRRGATGETGRDSAGSGGAGGKAEGVTAGDGKKSERREGGEGRASEDGGKRGAGEEVGRCSGGGGEGMEGGAERVAAAAVDAGDARVQEILAGGLTANQMAAKAMRLKLMGKAEEADCWQVGWAQVGWAQVGWAQVGWAQVGWAQVGWAQVGWAQRAAAAKSQPPPPAPPPALLAAPATSTLEPRALGEGRGDGEGEAGEGEGRREVVQLPLLDGSGRYLPAVMAAREGRDEVQAGRREKRVERYDVEGGTGQRASARPPCAGPRSGLVAARMVDCGLGVVGRGDGHGMGEARGGTDAQGQGMASKSSSTSSAIPSLPSAPPSLDYAPPSLDYAPPSLDYAPPSLDYAPPSLDHAPPSLDHAPPSLDHAPPSLDHAPPSLDHAPPSLDHAPPSLDHAPPSLDYAPPSLDHAPPSLDHAPPSLDHAPPSLDHAPPSLDHAPPSLDYAPPSLDHAPPSLDHAPPSLDHAPPSLDHAPPSLDHAPPSLDYAPPSLDHAPPSLDHAPPSLDHAPPSLDHAPPSLDHAPPSLDYAPPSLDHAPPSLDHAPPSLDYAPLTGSAPARPAGIGRAGGRYKGPVAVDDEYDWDEGLQAGGGGGGRKKGRPSQQQREKAGQVGEYRRQAAVQQRCQQCIDSPARPRHLVVSVAAHSYLMLPPGGSLLPNHVLIVPSEHEGSMRVVEEAVWDEVRNFKKCLTRMAMAVEEGAGVIFLESAVGVGGAGRQRKHCYVEAIPVPAAVMAQAPLYFKKVGRAGPNGTCTDVCFPSTSTSYAPQSGGWFEAGSLQTGKCVKGKGVPWREALDEAESEWSQQHSKRILDTRAIRGGLRGAIPPNFPYFHVEFGLQGGYCHVIDDESSFKASLGRDVIAGMMEMDPQRFGGRARARGGRGGVGSRPQEVQQSVAKFMESWKPFDWTKMLDG